MRGKALIKKYFSLLFLSLSPVNIPMCAQKLPNAPYILVRMYRAITVYIFIYSNHSF